MVQHIWKYFLLHRTATWPTDSLWNTIWGFTSVSALEKKPSSPSTKPPTTLPFLLTISFSYSDNTIKATQYRYVRQYSTVSNCKAKETLFLIRQCSMMKRKQTHLKFPMNEVKESLKITHQYVPSQCFYSLINVTFSCPCTSWWHMGERRYSCTHY